jgi:hypothetical protein
MKGIWVLIGGVGAGAVAMFLLDPAEGRRRRHALREGRERIARAGMHRLSGFGHHLVHEARGFGWRIAERWKAPVSDDLLAERVRSQVGHAVCYGGKVEVAVHEGRVTLSGPVFCEEVRRLVRRVSRIPGVTAVVNELEAYRRPRGPVSVSG